MIVERTGFCRFLKEARLRRDLTLEAIALSSKISASLLADLERGDLSRWPKGIFRRAFLREYAAAVGLPGEQLVDEAGRLFPEDGGVADEDVSAPIPGEELRLTLAPERRWWLAPSARRGLAACLDVALVLLVGTVVARVASGNFQFITSVVGLTYYGAATACLGATPSLLLLSRRGLLTSRRDARSRRAVVERPRLVFSGPGPSNPPVVENHQAHEMPETSHESRRAASQ